MKAIKGFGHYNRRKFFVVLAVCLFLFSATGWAFPSGNPWYTGPGFHLVITANEPAITEWILDKSVGNVDFYHAITVCNGKKAVFLKFNNKNNYRVKVTWKEVFKIPPGEKKDGYSGKKELVLAPGITSPKDCADVANKKNIILPGEIDPLSVNEILDFSFKEITVSNLSKTITQ